MELMFGHYVINVLARTWWQLFQLFTMPFVLAMALQWVGHRIRGLGFGRFGRAYLYFIALGVACHEMGHATGCLLTGHRIHKFVPFTLKYDDKLGYVSYSAPHGVWGGFAQVVISAGPIWFGCLMIVLLSRLFWGVEFVARYRDFFSNDAMPGMLEYVWGLARATLVFLSSLFIDGTWGMGFAVWFYIVFCIASEIGLSKVDIQHMCRGLAMIVVVFFLLNLVPSVGQCVSAGIFTVVPWLFKFHVLMLVALVLNTIMLFVIRLVVRLH